MKRNRYVINLGQGAIWTVCLCFAFNARADGIYGNGVGARSMAMGGADVAYAADPLGAMAVNPGALGFLTAPEFNLGAIGGFADGTFNKPGISNGSTMAGGALPEGAFAMPVGKSPVVVGISFVPESSQLVNWHYNDPPGGLGGATSYGYQQDQSEILALRSAFGVAVKFTPEFSFGASVGAVYNENKLTTPYIFQNLSPGGPGQPANSALDGAKTLLSLHTSGYGWNGMAGMVWRPLPDLQFGLSYESETQINSTGTASGDPSLQLGLPMGTVPFHYDAAVKTVLPQQVKAGVSWQFHPQWRLALQLDWIDYKDAFQTLPLSFSNGNNPTTNHALGSSFNEAVPLNWQSEFVYRAGIEFNVTDNLVLRTGYAYGGSPVPNSTLTPMNAAILENTFTAGIGYHWDRYSVDFAYQYDLPATQNIGTSGLLSGEYSNSSVKVSAQTFALTTTMRF